MRKATIIVIAAIYVASIVIVGVFGLKALNFDQTIFIKDIVLPSTIGGEPVRTSDKKHYFVDLVYKNELEVLIDYDKNPRDAQGDIKVTIDDQTPFGDGEVVATLIQSTSGTMLKFLQPGIVIIRFEAIDGSKVTKELTVVAMERSN